MAKVKKAVKKVSAATITRRRNKVFGQTTKRLEERLKEKELEIERYGRRLEDLVRSHNIQKEDWDRERIRLQGIETNLEKRFNDEKALAFKSMELEFKGKMQEEVNRVRNESQDKLNRGIEENFSKLKDSLAKLHEEGNAQTKFTEQIALKMMDQIKQPQQQPAITAK